MHDMRLPAIIALLGAQLTLGIPQAPLPPLGNQLTCKEQGCNDCPLELVASAGFPECNVYDINGFANFDYPRIGNEGYEVWWNSGNAQPGCQIIVRSPANVDRPGCGTVLRSWTQAGCWYTPIIDSTFMVQYCCGDVCDDALPRASPEAVRASYLQGFSASTTLVFKNSTGFVSSDQLNSEGVIVTKGLPSNPNIAGRAPQIAVPGEGVCRNFEQSARYTEAGESSVASNAVPCPGPDSCLQQVNHAVTVGRTITAGLDGVYEAITASIGLSFEESSTTTLVNSIPVAPGSVGEILWTPTYECVEGTVSGCFLPEDNDRFVKACTPDKLNNGDPRGTYSFRFTGS